MASDVLTAGCRRNVAPEKAELKGKRLVIAAELDEGMRRGVLRAETGNQRGNMEFSRQYQENLQVEFLGENSIYEWRNSTRRKKTQFVVHKVFR